MFFLHTHAFDAQRQSSAKKAHGFRFHLDEIFNFHIFQAVNYFLEFYTKTGHFRLLNSLIFGLNRVFKSSTQSLIFHSLLSFVKAWLKSWHALSQF